MDNELELDNEVETPAQPADLVTMMERPCNRRTVFALASWTAKRRPTGWYIRKTDHGGDWRGPYSTVASVSLMIARELGKELAKRDSFALHDRCDASPSFDLGEAFFSTPRSGLSERRLTSRSFAHAGWRSSQSCHGISEAACALV